MVIAETDPSSNHKAMHNVTKAGGGIWRLILQGRKGKVANH